MNPLKSRVAQASSAQKVMIFIGILMICSFVLLCYASLDPKAPPDSKFGLLSFMMILLMFGLWFLIPSCIFFYKKRTKPNITSLSDIEIDKLMTVLIGISVVCVGIGTIFSYFGKIEDFVGMLVVFVVILLFFVLQIKYRDKRRIKMKE
jgi:uncharacterized membrane protein HdeD (DUF308 family)